MNTELQQRIIKQATRMFLCNGIKSVTMDMIASQLGISKRTLYENFKENIGLFGKSGNGKKGSVGGIFCQSKECD